MKTRILFMGDSPTYNTGFAYVLKNLLTFFQKTNKFDIHCIGWKYNGEPYNRAELPFPIYPAKPFGAMELASWIDKLQPDIVFTLGDLFMIREIPRVIQKVKKYVRPKWVAYFPIDSAPLHQDDKNLLKYIDYPITYSKFAVEACKKLAPNINVENIPHGIWPKKYDSSQKKEIKKIQKFDNKYVVGFVGTNQERKQPARLLEVFKKFTCGYYNTKGNVCKNCIGHCSKYTNCKPDARLYLHTQIFDNPDPTSYTGYDLYELIHRYKLGKLIWNTPNIDYVKGLPEHVYITLLNCFNILWMGTQGEGCGIPTMEASALGIPVLTTNYSANEYNPDENNLIDVDTFLVDRKLSTLRALCDTNDAADKMNKYYERWKENGDEVFTNYKEYIFNKFDFNCILNRWLEIFSSIES